MAKATSGGGGSLVVMTMGTIVIAKGKPGPLLITMTQDHDDDYGEDRFLGFAG